MPVIPLAAARLAAVSARGVTTVVVAALITGCGSGSSTGQQVRLGGHGDAATFSIDGRTISVRESGRAVVNIAGAPELTHNGPVGCAGRYFTADFTRGVPLFFRYGSQDAYLLLGSDLYYLGGRPQRSAGALNWDTTTSGHQITVSVQCPDPPKSGPLTGSATPPACSILTPALAAATLRKRVGPPRFIPENPDLSYCVYKSLNGDRRVSVGVATAGELESLSSWQQPRIAGIGDEAHGGDASIGLAARQGKLGIEVVVDLGFNADAGTDLAAEESIARRVLSQLAR